MTFDGAGAGQHAQRGSTVVIDLTGVQFPETLRRKIDVIDFATPVQTVESNVAARERESPSHGGASNA